VRVAVSTIATAWALLLIGSCREAPKRETPKPEVTDIKPIGDGLKVIGYAVVGAAVVITVGRVLRQPS
jgi:hypothetical protein